VVRAGRCTAVEQQRPGARDPHGGGRRAHAVERGEPTPEPVVGGGAGRRGPASWSV
jgi:hypothetical protein